MKKYGWKNKIDRKNQQKILQNGKKSKINNHTLQKSQINVRIC